MNRRQVLRSPSPITPSPQHRGSGGTRCALLAWSLVQEPLAPRRGWQDGYEASASSSPLRPAYSAASCRKRGPQPPR